MLSLLNIEETDTFTSTTTGKSFTTYHKLNYGDNCLIYLLTCKCCGKQYLGEYKLDGTIIKAKVGKMHGMKLVCKNI